jgi:hypothetical protein
MSSYALRFLRRHPIRWATYWWLHLAVTALLLVIAWAWTRPVYDPVIAGPVWSLGLSVVAGLVLSTALAPLQNRLVALAATGMITVGLLRTLAYVEVAFQTDVAPALLTSLSAKWLLIAALGVVWPVWTRQAAVSSAVEAGEDELGGEGG